ncbi:hypothetical protein M5689_022312 [Euphorbia peplus]|nr:hypothetical protein M5689_022312 [Euphorbia peplus]
MAPWEVVIYSDSKLMVNQVNEKYDVKDATLSPHIGEIGLISAHLVAKEVKWDIVHVPWFSNTKATEYP